MTALLELEISSRVAIVTFLRPDSAIADSSMTEGQGPPLHDDSVETLIVDDESISWLKRLLGRLPSRLKRPKDDRVWGVYCVVLVASPPPTKGGTQEVQDASRHGVSVNGP